MKRYLYIVLVLSIAIIGTLVVRHIKSSRQAQPDDAQAVSPTKGLMTEKERVLRMKQLIAQKGGRPIDLALKTASSPEQRERLREKFAYQSETKDEAIEKAEIKLRDIEVMIGTAQDEAEKAKLERQRAALTQIIADLSGQ